MSTNYTERFAFRIKEACEGLGIGRTSLYEMIRDGEVKVVYIAGRTLIPRSEMERLTSVRSNDDK